MDGQDEPHGSDDVAEQGPRATPLTSRDSTEATAAGMFVAGALLGGSKAPLWSTLLLGGTWELVRAMTDPSARRPEAILAHLSALFFGFELASGVRHEVTREG